MLEGEKKMLEGVKKCLVGGWMLDKSLVLCLIVVCWHVMASLIIGDVCQITRTFLFGVTV
jgi:hypothetical protein